MTVHVPPFFDPMFESRTVSKAAMNNIQPTVFLNHDTEETICEKNMTF